MFDIKSPLFRFGLVASVLWLGLGFGFLWQFADWKAPLKPNEWGDVFAGLAAPIAFLWLVLGFLQQGQELKLSSKALMLQVDELKNTVEHQRELVNVTRQTAERELRAYLGVKAGFVRAPIDGKIVGSVDIANKGQTPAYGVRRFLDIAVLEIGHSDFAPTREEPGRWVIVPEAYWTLSKALQVTPSQLNEITAGTKTIFLWGKVTYDDIYGRELWTTEFRYRVGEEVFELQESKTMITAVNVFRGWVLDPISEGTRST